MGLRLRDWSVTCQWPVTELGFQLRFAGVKAQILSVIIPPQRSVFSCDPQKDSHQLQDGIFTWEASVLWQVDRWAENPSPPGIPRPIQVSHLNSVSLYSRRYGCPFLVALLYTAYAKL